MPLSFLEQFKKPVVSAGRTLGEWLKKGVQWKPPGYVSPLERPEIAKPIEMIPHETPPITTTLGKLFRGEEIQMIRPGSELAKVAEAQKLAREEIREKIGKPLAEKVVTAPREFAIPAVKGFLGKPIYERILEPVVPEKMRVPKGKILPAVGTIAGWMTAFGMVAGAFGKLMTASKIGQTLISQAPRIARAVQIAGAGLTLDQAHAPLESTIEERKKIFTTGLPRWAGWGIAGMIAPARVYAWLPTIFGTQYASAKLEGKSDSEAFGDALTMSAIFSLFKITELPKSPQQMLREQAFKKLGLKPKASAEEIRKAYHTLAHKYHPDIPGGDAEKFKIIADAYRILNTTPRQFQKDIFTEIRDYYRFLRSPEGRKMALTITEEMPVGLRIKAVKPEVKPEKIVKYELPAKYEPKMGKPTWKHGQMLWRTLRNMYGETNKFALDLTKNKGVATWVIDRLEKGTKKLEPLMKRYEGTPMTNKQYKKLYAMFKAPDYDLAGYRHIMANLKGIEPVVTEVKPAKTMAEVMKPEVEVKPIIGGRAGPEGVEIFPREAIKLEAKGMDLTAREKLTAVKQHEYAHQAMRKLHTMKFLEGDKTIDTLKKLYEKDKRVAPLKEDYEEVIADIYALYRVRPEYIKKNAPNLYAWMEENGGRFGKLGGRKVVGIPKKLPEIKKPPVTMAEMLKPEPGPRALVPYELKLPTGEVITKGRITRRVTAIKRLREEAKRIAEEKLGFILKGKPKVVKLTPAEKLRKAGIEPATSQQIKQIHVSAKEKVLISEKGKMKPQYRALAESMTGKRSAGEMTKSEASDFINALKKLSEPSYIKGKLVPPPISRITKIVPKGFFEGMKFKEPTIIRYLTPQTYYSQILGVKPLVEPLELAKQRFDLVYRDMANGVDKMIKAVDEIGKTTAKEKIRAKIKNVPTKAVKEMRNLLNEYEEAPADLSPAKKEIFNWFRNLTQETWRAENKVRAKLDLPLIEYRKAYVKHTADALAQEMLQGRYPFPEGLKYWSQRVVGKKIFNPMELRRKLADDLEELWTKDLAHATKSMLWTALKEIHLSQPLKFFNEQLGAVSKDILIYKNLTPEEQDIYSQIRTMPASTKKWLVDYVNQTIKGQETWLDTQVNNVVTKTGLKGLLNKVLAPFGRTVGRKPVTKVFQTGGRIMIHGVMGPIRPKQLIRNKFQLTQNLGLYTLKANLKGFYPASVDKNLESFLNESLFLKTYTGFEELPTNIQGKLEKLNLALFQWTAMSNVAQGMKVAYWDTLDLITSPKYKDLGWADPERIKLNYDVPEGKLYPSEREKLLKEMEFGASATQYHYIPMGMPEVFRYKALVPVTRLQSWWMNYFFKFNREAIMRGIKGETGYGAKLPWSRRLGWLRYLILGGLILNTLDYERSYLWGAAPTGVPPTAQFVTGLYTYLTTIDDLDEDWAKRKNAQAKNQMYYAMKTFVPGYLAWKDFMGLWSGEKSLKEYFFYMKEKEKKKPIMIKPIGEKTMGEIFKPTKRILESPILR